MNHAEEIQAVWNNYRGAWPTADGPDGRYFLPQLNVVRRRALPVVVDATVPQLSKLSEHYFTFTRELGSMDGRRWYRIVCEGVVVEDGPA